ncbi:hypothetical protein CBL_04551 [Carabus blaptoides fortunei]
MLSARVKGICADGHRDIVERGRGNVRLSCFEKTNTSARLSAEECGIASNGRSIQEYASRHRCHLTKPLPFETVLNPGVPDPETQSIPKVWIGQPGGRPLLLDYPHPVPLPGAARAHCSK